MMTCHKSFLRRAAIGIFAVFTSASAVAAPAPAPAERGVTASVAEAPRLGDPGFVRYLLDRVDDLHRGESSHALLQMKVQTEHWTRSMAMEAWSLGRDYSLVRILEPKKERGTATLKAKDDLFTYLSKTGRTIKITGAMLGGSWMGSHFTNDDLVHGTRLADDFEAVAAEGPTIEGAATYRITLTPKPDAPVVWGKIDVLVRQADLLPVQEVFHDEDMRPARRLDFADFREAGGRSFPARMTMTPLDRPGEFTEIRYARLDFDVALERGFFTLQRLQSM